MNDVIDIYNVYKLESNEDILSLFEKELVKAKTKTNLLKVCQDFHFFFWHNKKINTINQNLLKARKIVDNSNIKYKDFVKSFLRLGERASNCLREQKNNKAISNLDNKKESLEVDFSLIISNLKIEIENETFEVYNSQNKNEVKAHLMAIYLAFVTGRRFIEIYKTLTLSNKDEKIYFNNIAKQRGDKNKNIEAVLLSDDKTITRYLDFIRDTFKTSKMSNERVSSSYNGISNKLIIKMIGLDISMHDIRAIYAELAYQEFGGSSDKEKYFSEILGHSFTMNSTKHYLKYK